MNNYVPQKICALIDNACLNIIYTMLIKEVPYWIFEFHKDIDLNDSNAGNCVISFTWKIRINSMCVVPEAGRYQWQEASNYIPQYLWDVITCPCLWYLPGTSLLTYVAYFPFFVWTYDVPQKSCFMYSFWSMYYSFWSKYVFHCVLFFYSSTW